MKKTVRLTNPLGLHIRASTLLVQCASQYLSQIHISCKGKTVDAKRILEVITLGARHHDELTFSVEGQDAQEAMEALMASLDQEV